jgi:antitoxin component of MazEF toxin-antitoxin module
MLAASICLEKAPTNGLTANVSEPVTAWPSQFRGVRFVYTFHLEAAMARLTRWGNSDGGLRIPKAILEAAGLHVGDEMGCRLLDSGAILLTPHHDRTDITEGKTKSLGVSRPDAKW